MKQYVSLSPGDLSNSETLNDFINGVKNEIGQLHEVSVSLKKTGDLTLSQFNSLIALYIHMMRSGKILNYIELTAYVKKFVRLTKFQGVFES